MTTFCFLRRHLSHWGQPEVLQGVPLPNDLLSAHGLTSDRHSIPSHAAGPPATNPSSRLSASNPNAGYAGMFVLVTGLYPISTLAVTWIATNLSPDSKRAIGMPFAYSIANISNLVSSQLYPTQQGPRYIQGNAVSAGLTVVAAFLYGSCWVLLKRRNAEKAKMIAEGATTNGLEGDRSLESMYIL